MRFTDVFSFLLLISVIGLATPMSGQEPRSPDILLSSARKDLFLPQVRPRVGLLAIDGLPTSYGPKFGDALAETFEVTKFVSVSDTALGLRRDAIDVLVVPAAAHFMVESWPTLRTYLASGGHVVFLDGNPLSEPFVLIDGRPVLAGPPTPTYQHDLLIGPAERIECQGTMTSPDPDFVSTVPAVTSAYALTVRFTTLKDFKDEDGTSGPRDAIVRPLIQVLEAGRPVAAPLIAIDRLRGEFAGGRWIFWTGDRPLDSSSVVDLIQYAAKGPFYASASIFPVMAEPGTPTRLRVSINAPRRQATTPVSVKARIVLDNKVEFSTDLSLTGGTHLSGTAVLPASSRPGHHVVTIDLGEFGALETAFEVRDASTTSQATALGVSRDWITRNGKPWPIVGTTYMDSEVHRKFLFEPNAARWERDFAWMRAEGINYVRTGFWTGWSRVMLDSGAVDPAVLNSLDAYIQCAARNNIVVCFNFFAFSPEQWGGTNPYLDPRSLEAQIAFVTAFASHFKDNPWIHWDLINEPSYSPTDQLWTNRPVGDAHERGAFSTWIKNLYPGESDAQIKHRWQDPSDGPLTVPRVEDLTWGMVRDGKMPKKALDFGRFSNATVAAWASQLRSAIRASYGDKTPALVTLGQDEGGTDVRPAHLLMAGSLDYTSLHNWWQNDDLLFDSVMTKAHIPSLVQESGLMRAETMDGDPLRSPEDAANLLARKYAWAFAARSCGVVQWAWNINPYMPIDNEAVIGFVRPDGTMKPEARVSRAHSKFWADAAPYLSDARLPEVAIVVPHSRLFLGRPEKLLAVKRTVRVLAQKFGVVPQAYSEWTLRDHGAKDLLHHKLVVVPCPEYLDAGAAEALSFALRQGVPVMLTGALEGTPSGDFTPAFVDLGAGASRAVAFLEPTTLARHPNAPTATFDNRIGEWLRIPRKPSVFPNELPLIREDVPIEFAREPELLTDTLRYALGRAKVEVIAQPKLATLMRVHFERATLFVAVNESSSSDAIQLPGMQGNDEIRLGAGHAHLRLVAVGEPRRVIDLEK